MITTTDSDQNDQFIDGLLDGANAALGDLIVVSTQLIDDGTEYRSGFIVGYRTVKDENG